MEPKTKQDPIEIIATFAGEAAELVSFNRSVGQLYGALYMSGRAMSLKELALVCKMSKGNASIHLRTLEEWGAAERTSRTGTREDYYTANTNIEELAQRRLKQGLTKRLQLARTKLDQVKNRFAAASSDPSQNQKMRQLEELLGKAESFMSLLQKFSKLQGFLPFGGGKDSQDASR